ncbi:MAG: hypothetical protein A2284_04235 [Deltaproteobacteria bacterium RIFOXYA12_FULL_61_11]|nr:MAG: hypothetical protein A2284_04235 [Deltaproteobacteria bacterium RIFOXYA12_FULL_61_11]
MKPRRTTLRSGFTLVELVLGLLLGALVVLAAIKAGATLDQGWSQAEEEASDRAADLRVLDQIRRDLFQAGSDPSPRIDQSADTYGFALGRLETEVAAIRGILPVGSASFQVLALKPYDKDRDGKIAANEGLCLDGVVTGTSLLSPDPDCYSTADQVGTVVDHVPLKAISRDNILYSYDDCDQDGQLDCLVTQNLGDHRTSNDDGTVEVLLRGVEYVRVFYLLDDNTMVFYDSSTGLFNDGSDDNVALELRNTIKEVILELGVRRQGKDFGYRLSQRIFVDV